MIALLVALLSLAPAAQAPRDARVAVTVVDQTGAVIPNAKVTLTLSAATTPAAEPATTKENGIASLAGLPPGRYTIQAEFPGFQTRILKDIQLKAGDNKHVAVLAIEGFSDSVTVSRDAREAASDRRSTFGTAMTREQIDSLSDDPAAARDAAEAAIPLRRYGQPDEFARVATFLLSPAASYVTGSVIPIEGGALRAL